MESTSNMAPRGVGRFLAYDSEQVDEFLAKADAERASLTRALADAQARLAELREHAASTTSLRDRLGALVVEARETARTHRAEAEATIAGIVEAAEREAETLLANARAEAAGLRSGAASGETRPPDEVVPIDLSARFNEVG